MPDATSRDDSFGPSRFAFIRYPFFDRYPVPLHNSAMRTLLMLLTSFLILSTASARPTAVLSPSSQVFAQQTQALRELQYSLQSLNARFDSLEQQQQSILSRLSALERGGDAATKDELNALRADLSSVRSGQNRLREEIVRDLSKKIADISARETRAREKAAEAARKAAAAAAKKSGYTHVVEAGETLSAIAEAYKVPLKTIMRANRITDPSRLRIGQKLFVPDP